MTTKAIPVPGSVEHDGCRYHAPVFRIEDCGDFWFCNKCGQGGEVFPPCGQPTTQADDFGSSEQVDP